MVLKNFLTTLKRFRLASFLNIIGLTVAFAAFMLIMIQVRFNYSFDRCYSGSGNIFRVEVSNDSTEYNALVGPNMYDVAMRSLPQVQNAALLLTFSNLGNYISVEKEGERTGFNEEINHIFPAFLDIFDFQFVEGNAEKAVSPGHVLIPESRARLFWGGQPALDKPIRFVNLTDSVLYVGGVYKDFPNNSQLKNPLYTFIHDGNSMGGNGWNFNFNLFVTLTDPALRKEAEQALLSELQNIPDSWINQVKAVRFNPIEEILFTQDTFFDQAPKASRSGTRLLTVIALMILAIAAINFVNFSTSLTPLRIRSINTQKVLGSSLFQLRAAMVLEAVGFCLIGYFLALGVVIMAKDLQLGYLFTADITLSQNLPIALYSLAIAMLVGLIAGIYPSIYSTSFAPAMVLKGSFAATPQGRMLRTGLISLQFIVSIGLIIGAVFLQLQNHYMRKLDTGIHTEQIAVVRLGSNLFQDYRLLTQRLTEQPHIEDVGYSKSKIGGGDEHTFNSMQINGETMRYYYISVSWNLAQLLGIGLTQGNYLTEDASRSAENVYMLNEAAQRMSGMNLGELWNNQGKIGTVAAITENFNYQSLYQGVEPLVMAVENTQNRYRNRLFYAYIKITGDPYAGVDEIKKAFASLDPGYPVEIEFYDTIFNNLYQSERKTTGLITLFSLLAIVISLVGVFGLVVFDTQYRRKEIGVRKIHGATVAEILGLFNKGIVRIVLICFCISAPIAWYGIHKWLEQFAFRTPLHWWVFALTLLVIFLIAVLTVTSQSYRAATENPAKSLKNE